MTQQPNYNYLDLLNEQQREAVVYKDGPALVIAGAGSGKTRVLTYKIVDLIRSGYEPYRILALTFTNKAAREMKERVVGEIGEKIAARLWMGTFHSIFLRILRRHAENIGFKAGFTIYDSADSRSLLKLIIKELNLDDKIYKPASIQSEISRAKNNLMTPDIYMRQEDINKQNYRSKRPMTGEIYSIYCQRCRRANAMDFDDILLFMNILLRDNPDICRHYQDFFRYILVDEYQDTNFAQHLIISRLGGKEKKICVVGDDAQSIYSFRGANIANILDMDKNIPGLRIYKLERNYRSTQNIINAAGSLIEKNTHQMRKHVFSENETGEPVAVVQTYSDMEEAFMVANMISRSKLTHHESYDNYAVLYRTNAQSRVLEESLRKRNIPYRIYGGLSFYQRKEVKDILSYFRLTINPDDDEALRRIINYPARGIGETTMKKLQECATQAQQSLWQTISDIDSMDISINSGTRTKLKNFKLLIDEFISDNREGSDAYELGQLIYNRTGILTALAHDNTPESISRQENLSEVLAGLKDFVEIKNETGEDDVDMRSFLSEVMLATDQDTSDSTDEPKVTLMTAHAAKGLEFNHVYVVGVEEELFPSAMSMDTIMQVEEERRLLYVAMTRARKTLTLTYAGSRFRNGQTVQTKPSRFLSDIDTRYLKMQMSSTMGDDRNGNFMNPVLNYRNSYSGGFSTGYSQSPAPRQQASANAAVSPSPARRKRLTSPGNGAAESTPKVLEILSRISVGTRIRHGKFGEGTITDIDKTPRSERIEVNFDLEGPKKLLLEYAIFTIIS